ncbi:MAG: hypothetical protein HOH74_19635 [Gemmatimonadetes bacterium]|jgi:hypothetical protein|nr:hypothetical protein [Gemmatimonadota bacterium]
MTGRYDPVDEATFRQIAETYTYDRSMSLNACVIGTATHNGRELPYLTDKISFRSANDETVVG